MYEKNVCVNILTLIDFENHQPKNLHTQNILPIIEFRLFLGDQKRKPDASTY